MEFVSKEYLQIAVWKAKVKISPSSFVNESRIVHPGEVGTRTSRNQTVKSSSGSDFSCSKTVSRVFLVQNDWSVYNANYGPAFRVGSSVADSVICPAGIVALK